MSSKGMKRLLNILFAIVLLAPSCQKDAPVDASVTVTYTLVPEVSFHVKSGDETTPAATPTVNSLSYRVYHRKMKADGTYYYDYIEEMGAYVEITDASDIHVPITLIKDQYYKLVFIAQHRFDSRNAQTTYAYTVSEGGIMSVNTEAQFTSGDQLEAFAFVDEVGPITGNENRNARLHRVVSQVNIGTSANDLPAALDIAVSGAPAEYDILNNVYSDSSNELNFRFAVPPSGKISVSGIEYNSLATLYCLGSNDLALTLTNADSADDTFSISNVATKVNYKTNIVGNIELARPVASVGATVYSTLAAAARAAESGNTITLLQDVTLADPVTLPAGVTFNGNGNQITGTIIAGGSLTFAGHTKVEKFIADCNGYTFTIPERACLEITGKETPFKVGYGNTFIIGSTEVVSANPSLIIPAGIKIEGTSGDNFQFWNTKVQLGSIISDPDKASGTFNFNLTTSEATIARKIDLAAPTNGKTPIYHITLAQSELTTVGDFYIGAPGTQNNPTTLVLTSSTMNVGGEFSSIVGLQIDSTSTLNEHCNITP